MSLSTEPDPISYEGKSILIDTNNMVVGKPYPLLYRNAKAVAIKHKDGSVSFYTTPNWFLRLFPWLY